MKVLEQSEMLAGDELTGAGKVLRAAAMTYVAALLTALAQLLRLILIFWRTPPGRLKTISGDAGE